MRVRIGSVARICAGVVLGWASAAAALESCSEAEGRWAWPLLSPIAIRDSATGGQARLVDVPADRPLGWIANGSGTTILICRPDGPGWVAASDVAQAERPRRATLTADVLAADRSNLLFWRSAVDAERFLSGGAVGSPPDFIEIRDASAIPAASLSLPVVSEIEIDLGGRAVSVVELVLPVAAPAAEAWRSILNQNVAVATVVVLDRSGSAAGYSEAALTAVLRHLTDADLAAAPAMAIAVLGADAYGMAEAATLLHLPTLDIRQGDGTTLEEHLATLPGAPPAILVLAGGDVALPDLPVLRDSPALIVGQVTPELDPELQATSTELGASFHDFDTDLGGRVARTMAQVPGFRQAAAGDMAARRQYGVTQAEHGFLSFLPSESAPDLAPPDTAGAEWSGLRAWTILNPFVLALETAIP